MAKIVQHRRGTITEWKSYQTLIPLEGELVVEMDDTTPACKVKIGNGINTYAELPYLNADAALKRRTIEVDSPFPNVMNCGIRVYANPVLENIIGKRVESFYSYSSGGSDFSYRIYPNLPLGQYEVTTRCNNSTNYPYYAFLVETATGNIKHMFLASTYDLYVYPTETVTITEEGLSLYIQQNSPMDEHYKVSRIVYEQDFSFITEQFGNPEAMYVGREVAATKKLDYIAYNETKKYLNFGWITDPHYDSRPEDNGDKTINNLRLFSEICNEGYVDIGMVGGDLTSALDASKKQSLENVSRLTGALRDIAIPVYYLRGNHDLNAKSMRKANLTTKTGWAPNWDENQYFIFEQNSVTGSYLYSPVTAETWDGDKPLYIRDSDQQISTLTWAMFCQNHIEANFDKNNRYGGYFYKDFENEKIRLIITNCYENESKGEGLCWGAEQTKFIAQEALNFEDKVDRADWGVILFAHDIPADLILEHELPADATSTLRYEAYDRNLLAILQAFQDGRSISCHLRGGEAFSIDYSAQGAMNLVATIHGHTHTDEYDTGYGWRNIGTIAAYDAYGDDKTKPEQEFGISVFTIDTDTDTIYETRIGRGQSRTFPPIGGNN